MSKSNEIARRGTYSFEFLRDRVTTHGDIVKINGVQIPEAFLGDMHEVSNHKLVYAEATANGDNLIWKISIELKSSLTAQNIRDLIRYRMVDPCWNGGYELSDRVTYITKNRFIYDGNIKVGRVSIENLPHAYRYSEIHPLLSVIE